MADPAHEVWIPCDCGNIEVCRLELYVSDVRIAYAELRRCQEAERDDGRGLAISR